MYPLYTVVYDTYTLQYVYITSSSQNALYKPANAPLPVTYRDIRERIYCSDIWNSR